MIARRRFTLIVVASAITCSILALSQAGATIINGRCYPHPVRIGVINEGPADAPKVAQANLEWVRITIPWRAVQPNSSTWSWGSIDNRVNSHFSRGRRILAILSTAPQWAGSNAHGTRPVGTVQNTSLWEEFVRRVAIRYAGKIDAYEIWNEPDFIDHEDGVGWDGPLFNEGGGALPYYALYVQKASQRIRANAPGTLVVAPATRSRAEPRTNSVFTSLQQYGTAAHMDVVSFHANATTSDSSNTVWSRIESYFTRIRNRNPANQNKPVWITEFGWATAQNGEGGQRDKIRSIAERLAWGWRDFSQCAVSGGPPIPKTALAFIWQLKDTASNSRGIYRQNGTPKAVVTQYLQTLPVWGIQAPTESPLPYAQFNVSCSGRTCTFTSGYSDNGQGFVYDWDFGDGATAVGRVVTHTYSKRGLYHVYHGTPRVSVFGSQPSDARIIEVP